MNNRLKTVAKKYPEVKEALQELTASEHAVHKTAHTYVNAGNDIIDEAYKDGRTLGKNHAKRGEPFDRSVLEEAQAVAESLKEDSARAVKSFDKMIKNKDPKAFMSTYIGRSGQLSAKLAYYAGYLTGFMNVR